MERHEILEAMTELKLYGMRANFDEIAGKGLARRDEIYPLIASLIRRNAHTVKPARSATASAEPSSRSSKTSTRSSSPKPRSTRASCANSPPGSSSMPSAMESSSAAPAPAKPICASRSLPP